MTTQEPNHISVVSVQQETSTKGSGSGSIVYLGLQSGFHPLQRSDNAQGVNPPKSHITGGVDLQSKQCIGWLHIGLDGIYYHV